jgi:hypothetical protein
VLKQYAAAVATSRAGLREWLSVRCATLNRDNRNESKKLSVRDLGRRAKFLRRGIGSSGHSRRCPAASSREAELEIAPMTVSSPHVIEIKLDRLIDDMRLLRSQMIAFNRQLHGIEAYLKPKEPSEQQPESKSRPWFAARC